MKADNVDLKIYIDKTDEAIEYLESYGYEKRSGGASYPQYHNTITIIPSKKWYWTEETDSRGISEHIMY